jgi:hypothetical protein
VLFSRNDVANFVNQYFEPTWESTRPVPLVRIDFGNGKVVTRTLHGNIATSVCSAEGEVLDILPGIYTPKAFLAQLSQFRLLANYVDLEGSARRAQRAKEYHEVQSEQLKKKKLPAELVNVAPISKRAIEDRIKAALLLEPRRKQVLSETLELPETEEIASWKPLALDTQVNESVRRLQIHELLAKRGLVQPSAISKPLYRDILHADLDDPYLGLGNLLFAGYPFKDK